MKATKIRMKQGCLLSSNPMEIDEIYLEDSTSDGYYKKEFLHDYVKSYPKSIYVDIKPYPFLIPSTSSKGEKYVRSNPNSLEKDNLLKLPRE